MVKPWWFTVLRAPGPLGAPNTLGVGEQLCLAWPTVQGVYGKLPWFCWEKTSIRLWKTLDFRSPGTLENFKENFQRKPCGFRFRHLTGGLFVSLSTLFSIIDFWDIIVGFEHGMVNKVNGHETLAWSESYLQMIRIGHRDHHGFWTRSAHPK